jgi:hypothetical protein
MGEVDDLLFTEKISGSSPPGTLVVSRIGRWFSQDLAMDQSLAKWPGGVGA